MVKLSQGNQLGEYRKLNTDFQLLNSTVRYLLNNIVSHLNNTRLIKSGSDWVTADIQQKNVAGGPSFYRLMF